MDFLLIAAVALLASALTFFSGFGLGTLLLPAFALFFPAEVAVALTAVVHLLNNGFKLLLVGCHADLGIAVRFGAPAMVAAIAGARVLVWLSDLEPLLTYRLGDRRVEVEAIDVAIATLMLAFAALEAWPRFGRFSVPAAYLPVGGVLTGFFGGLSGHQGALRSAFLLRAGLSKEGFIATGVVVGTGVDVARMAVYSDRLLPSQIAAERLLLLVAVIAAFSGAVLGNRLLRRVTLRSVELTVAVMLAVVALALGSGLI